MEYGAIYDLVRKIPHGRVATYGQIAAMSGNPRCARAVGYALHCCRDAAVPCHRVVNRTGGLCGAFVPLGKESHRARLMAEGVGFLEDGRVDLARFRWDGAGD